MYEFLAVIPGPLPVKLALLALPVLPNLWGIWHAHKHRFLGQEQLIWMAICVFVPFFGGLAYLLLGRARTIKAAESQNDN